MHNTLSWYNAVYTGNAVRYGNSIGNVIYAQLLYTVIYHSADLMGSDADIMLYTHNNELYTGHWDIDAGHWDIYIYTQPWNLYIGHGNYIQDMESFICRPWQHLYAGLGYIYTLSRRHLMHSHGDTLSQVYLWRQDLKGHSLSRLTL